MNVIVSLEYRFKRTPDGKVWTEMSFQYPFWKRYLKVFDNVIIISRIKNVERLESKHHLVSGENLIFHPIPYYHGPKEFLFQRSKIKKSLKECLKKHRNAAIIMRVGSPIADLLRPLIPKKRPYALEVVGDPWDVFRPGAFKNPLRPFMRLVFTMKLKHQCSKAASISYVTNYSLQKRYPGKKGFFSIAASTIELKEEHILKEEKLFIQNKAKTFIFVGTLEQLQKAPDILLKAIKILSKKTRDFNVVFIGDGKYRSKLEKMAYNYKINDLCIFKGLLPAGDAIRSELDKSDFFVLPSRGEGLPRAMIEAMARGLPALGSDIGGIKELIENEFISKAGSEKELANNMELLLNKTPQELSNISKRNIVESKKYLHSTLEKRRTNFYQHIKEQSLQWIENEDTSSR